MRSVREIVTFHVITDGTETRTYREKRVIRRKQDGTEWLGVQNNKYAKQVRRADDGTPHADVVCKTIQAMTGTRFLQQLRDRAARGEVPVIVINPVGGE